MALDTVVRLLSLVTEMQEARTKNGNSSLNRTRSKKQERRDKVAACAKHFVGDGGTTHGIDENNTVINQHDLLSIHMPPYYDSIIKGVSTVTVSYSSWNGERMHANGNFITGYLKDKLNFKGFVISDWEGIDRITSPPHVWFAAPVIVLQ